MRIHYRRLFHVVFLLAFALRLGVALYNTQSNDDHLTVIRIILNEHRIPADEEDWEAFQPKLYHVTTALAIKSLPFLDRSYNVKIAQFLNLIAGMVTVYYGYRFLKLLPFSDRTRFWSFTLLALNPQFIAINSQATNDSFAIVFFTLSLYHAVRFFRHPRWTFLALLTLFAILAGLSKGNGILMVPIFLGAWLVEIARRLRSGRASVPRLLWVAPVVFLVFYLATVPYFGQYIGKQQEHGSPFATNMPVQPMPALFERTYVARPGVTSIAESYFTFRYLDLLLVPRNTSNKVEGYRLQRTSLWTQLYARSFFAHYDQHPKSWRDHSRFIMYVGRFLFLLALIPTALGIWGLLQSARSLLEPTRAEPVAYRERWIYLLTIAGFLGFVILYSLRIRDYSTMKAIFLFPGMLGFSYTLAVGMESFWTVAKRPSVRLFAEGGLAAMVLLGCVDILCLIRQLAQ